MHQCCCALAGVEITDVLLPELISSERGFDSASILAIACTCRSYSATMRHNVRAATQLSKFVCICSGPWHGCLYVLLSRVRRPQDQDVCSAQAMYYLFNYIFKGGDLSVTL